MNVRPYIYGFWDRLNETVKESGMSKREIAEKIGCDRKALSDYGSTLSPLYIARFCVVTGVSADYLLGIKER